MRRMTSSILWLCVAALLAAMLPPAAHGEPEAFKLPKLRKASGASRAARLRSSSAFSDTVYIGGGGTVTAANPWGLEAIPGDGPSGSGLTSVARKGGFTPRAMWSFDTPVNGDSLQGWVPTRIRYFSFGSGRSDRIRPESTLDAGNQLNRGVANMTASDEVARRKTPGVIGLWHVDGGNTVIAPASAEHEKLGPGSEPSWAPLGGNSSAWMGARRLGDHSYVDAVTGNPFTETVFKAGLDGSFPFAWGGFPGYPRLIDQMLYRDIDVSNDGGRDLVIGFDWRTNMSTGLFLNDPVNTVTGWFNFDWLAAPGDPAFGGPLQEGNFVSAGDAGLAGAPIDSFMVYIGRPVDDDACWYTATPQPLSSNPRPVWDKQRRWLNEILDIGDPSVAPGGPPLSGACPTCDWNKDELWQQLLSVAGDNPVTSSSVTIPSARVAQMERDGRVRLVFRVKTNYGPDDHTDPSYSSGRAGAAVVDNVDYAFVGGGASPIGWGDFENTIDIDNEVATDPLDAWKSTGKPPKTWAHAEHTSNPTIIAGYQDICGAVGTAGRIADLSGGVISFGDHDNGDVTGGLEPGTAEYERNAGIFSPVIDLTASSPLGFAPDGQPGDRLAGSDYVYIRELYAGDMNVFVSGHLWRFGGQEYPVTTPASKGAYDTWGGVTVQGFSYFNPDRQAFTIADGLRINSKIVGDGIHPPDSARVITMHRTLCYLFGLSNSCANGNDLFLLDNASIAIVDGAPKDMHVEIWHWINDAFPANEDDALVGGSPAAFDTMAAHIRTGLNTAPTDPGCCPSPRFLVPGDTTEIVAPGTDVRVDMVFRILPGPGNYVNIGRPDLADKLRLVPTSPAPVSDAPAPTSTNFWEAYLADNGMNGTPGGHPVEGGAKVWDPNVWNSARCDSEEINVFPFSGEGLEDLPTPGEYMSAYHEDDPKFATLGIVKNRCFVAHETAALNDLDCLTVPSYILSGGAGGTPGPPINGYDGIQTTREYTKILPDGHLTPGAHVQYFFRKSVASTNALTNMVPDTNVVFPQPLEDSFDAHRWQQFGILPDRWKDHTYVHPVTGDEGLGMACLLAVDYADRRGSERVFISVMDSLWANLPARHGAHNGWSAAGGGDLNDPANFVAAHYGQPGSSFDFYQKKASESLTIGIGLGDRLGFRDPTNPQINDKASRQGPTPKMLATFYRMVWLMTADLNSGILGPYENQSTDDVKLLTDWLTGPDEKGIWITGEGFIASVDPGTPQLGFIQDVMGAVLREDDYRLAFNFDLVPDVHPLGPLNTYDIHGVRNDCTIRNDVLDISGGIAGADAAVVAKYEDVGTGSPPYPALPLASSILKPSNPGNPWIALVDGWSLESLTGRFDLDTQGRQRYVHDVFTNVFGSLCNPLGFPPCCSDVPTTAGLEAYLAIGNNPLRDRHAKVHFGLPKADRVTIRVYDVSGRLVRTLSDRQFAAGEHQIVWDGYDDRGRRLANGVYFTKVRFHANDFRSAKKLTVLK